MRKTRTEVIFTKKEYLEMIQNKLEYVLGHDAMDHLDSGADNVCINLDYRFSDDEIKIIWRKKDFFVKALESYLLRQRPEDFKKIYARRHLGWHNFSFFSKNGWKEFLSKHKSRRNKLRR